MVKPNPSIVVALQQHGYCTIVHKVSSISGGCISDTCRYETDQGVFFVKIQQGDNALSMFQAEYLSLSLINHAIKGFAPQPMLYGTLDNGRGAYLVMEYVEMSSRHDANAQRKLAHRLVELHRISAITSFDSSDPLIAQINELNLDEFHITSNKSNVYTRHYGFPCTTFCGTTPQTNKAWPGSWSTFWRDQRLQPLLTMLKHDKQLTGLGQALMKMVPQIIGDDTSITPSLIHGDLWSGNWGIRTDTGEAIIYDPAMYFGHHEAEFGIINMCGGLSNDFYEIYNQAFPPNQGYNRRQKLYELYHQLNHYIIMNSTTYRDGAIRLMRQLLNEHH